MHEVGHDQPAGERAGQHPEQSSGAAEQQIFDGVGGEQPGPALAAALAALVVTVALGLVGTFAALGQKPAQVLRNL